MGSCPRGWDGGVGLLGRPGLGAARWLCLCWLRWSKSEELPRASQSPASLQRDRACASPAFTHRPPSHTGLETNPHVDIPVKEKVVREGACVRRRWPGQGSLSYGDIRGGPQGCGRRQARSLRRAGTWSIGKSFATCSWCVPPSAPWVFTQSSSAPSLPGHWAALHSSGQLPSGCRAPCHQESRCSFHRLGSKHAPWAVQQGGTESPADPRKAAVGKGTLPFPQPQKLGLLCHPADEIQEVRNLFYCLLCRRKGWRRRGSCLLMLITNGQYSVPHRATRPWWLVASGEPSAFLSLLSPNTHRPLIQAWLLPCKHRNHFWLIWLKW